MNQYFVPALISILLSALVFFFVLPRLSPYILGAMSVLMLALGVWQHYSMFPYEYRTSIVTELLQQYAGFIMILLVIAGSSIGILMVHGTDLPEVSQVIPEMPMMSTNNSKNNSANQKNMFNFGGNESKNNGKANGSNAGLLANPVAAVTNAFNSVSNAVTNAANGVLNGKANNAKKNNLASPSFKVV